MLRKPLLLLLPLICFCSLARASEDALRVLGEDENPLLENVDDVALDPAERLARTQEVFRHFQIAPELAKPAALAPYSQTQSMQGARLLLPLLDPQGQFEQFFSSDPTSLSGYLDGGIKRVLDFRTSFAASDESRQSSGLLARLRHAARSNPAERPLAGLRIALDPGHMGTDLWDSRTDKFTKDSKGNRLSEGLLALQTALLLEKRFTALGAEVSLTRKTLSPVAKVPYEQLPISEFAREELRGESLKPWFLTLLKSATGEALGRAFDAASQVKKLFGEFSRGNFFVLRADLDARVKSIAASRPDLTLILHFDADGGLVDREGPRPADGTKAYVAGYFEPTELATQKQRISFARKLVDREGWEASYALNRHVVNALSKDLGIPFSKAGGGFSKQLEPGLFARNLGIPSRLDGHAVAYLELLQYDDPNEFRALRDYKYKLSIEGVEYPYAERLVTVAKAVERGVVEFVKGYQAP